ncbi:MULTISPECIES: acetyltransferase [Aquimarina]|uniref:acetyltransferase n=1 Tax=Aquimarina TaxID=290174 RepID=UPI000944DECF|nr:MULTISPECIES: acetyltransferase [Aquimarina]
MTKLLLLGGGGHCESVIEVLEMLPDYQVIGILDPIYSELTEAKILGYPILGNDDDVLKYIQEGCEFVITVGQIKSAAIRRKLFTKVKSHGGKLPVIISSTAHVSKHATIGEGTVIMNFSMVNSNTSIGAGNIINTFANIEHGCRLGDFNHISTRATVNGDVNIYNDVFIGSGTIVNEGCTIEENVVIGSGSLVRKNISSNKIARGNPIKIIKK